MPKKKPMIIAIDDEVEFVNMLKDYFGMRGYNIIVASKATLGVELINNNKPDVVLLDLKMPGVSGDEILKLVQSKHPEARVIFVTAFDDAGKTRGRLLNAGAYAFLEKPVNSLKQLEDVVNKAYSETSKGKGKA
jgi:DNA-binding NtrC family response regulator